MFCCRCSYCTQTPCHLHRRRHGAMHEGACVGRSSLLALVIACAAVARPRSSHEMLRPEACFCARDASPPDGFHLEEFCLSHATSRRGCETLRKHATRRIFFDSIRNVSGIKIDCLSCGVVCSRAAKVLRARPGRGCKKGACKA